MSVVKIGRVELLESEAAKLYKEGKYIVTYSAIYQIFHSVNAGYYGSKIISKPTRGGVGFVKRGRFMAMDGETVNRLLGHAVVNA